MRVLVVALIVMIAAFAAASYSVHLANEAARDSREALCKVLLRARQTKIVQATTIEQLNGIDLYYRDLIALVKGCSVP